MPIQPQFQKGQRLYYVEPGQPHPEIVTFELYDHETPLVLEGNPTAIVTLKERASLSSLRVRLADLYAWEEYYGGARAE